MSYPPTDPFSKNQPNPQGEPNPYAAPSGSNPPQHPAAQGGQPTSYSSPGPYGPATNDAPYGGQQAPYGGQQAPYGGQQSPYGSPQQAPYGAPQQTPYGASQPPGSSYNPYAPPPPNDGMAIASLVCSIAGIFLCGIPGIVGLILGIVSLNRINKTGARGKGMAIAGIIVGALAVLWLVLSFALGFFSVFTTSNSYDYY